MHKYRYLQTFIIINEVFKFEFFYCKIYFDEKWTNKLYDIFFILNIYKNTLQNII